MELLRGKNFEHTVNAFFTISALIAQNSRQVLYEQCGLTLSPGARVASLHSQSNYSICNSIYIYK